MGQLKWLKRLEYLCKTLIEFLVPEINWNKMLEYGFIKVVYLLLERILLCAYG